MFIKVNQGRGAVCGPHEQVKASYVLMFNSVILCANLYLTVLTYVLEAGRFILTRPPLS